MTVCCADDGRVSVALVVSRRIAIVDGVGSVDGFKLTVTNELSATAVVLTTDDTTPLELLSTVSQQPTSFAENVKFGI